MSEKEYAKYQKGQISKIFVHNAFINSCVPHQFSKQSQKAAQAQSDLLMCNKIPAGKGHYFDFQNAFYVNEPKVRR